MTTGEERTRRIDVAQCKSVPTFRQSSFASFRAPLPFASSDVCDHPPVTKAVSVVCPNCGATLTVEAKASQAVCSYCGTSSEIQRGGPAPPKQPLPQWQPPAAGYPAQPPPMPARPMVIHVPQVRVQTWSIWLTLIFVAVPLIGVLVPLLVTSGVLAPGWDGKEPFSCGANDRYKIEDVKADLPGTAMNIGGNCHVELRDVKIEGKTAVKIGGNGRLTLFSGTLKGDKKGIEVGGNGRVVLHKGTVKGGDYAIDASINADVDTGGAKIKGKKRASMNARIDGEKH